MASSRKSTAKAKPEQGRSPSKLPHSDQYASIGDPKAIGVALSGGLDSVVLLHSIAQAYAAQKTRPAIYAFHIHHGLQKAADDWLLFCQSFAEQCGAIFDFRLLHMDTQTEAGNMEARARVARYEALVELCDYYAVDDLLLAHHQNDQAETVLLQLLRGAGVAGLSGMPVSRAIGSANITLWRPLLQLSRAELEAYAREHELVWVEDPSNRSSKYRRNAIRKSVLPKLEAIQPGATANLARSADLLGQAQQLLDRLALIDAKGIWEKKTGMLRSTPLLELAQSDRPAANNVLRYWLKTAGLVMPSFERLQAWWLDLQHARSDAQLEWEHDACRIRLWRGLLQVDTSPTQDGNSPASGDWVFVPISGNSKKPGLPAEWVAEAKKAHAIEFKQRAGSERLQCAEHGPRKTLKNLYQEHAVPPWQRQAPLLYIEGELIAVAGVGVSYPHLVAKGKRVLPEWRALQAGVIPKTL
ncbi:MAG: tRNA lysidine(34) synthetase TilS [Polynucleobacter sp.]|nr:tRNA lysidine(34) synthetase TilS [Polynucleobacter sp.]